MLLSRNIGALMKVVKPTTRRGFLGRLGLSPIAMVSLVKDIGNIAVDTALNTTGVGRRVVLPRYGAHPFAEPTLHKLYQAGLLPGWATRKLRRETMNDTYRMNADISSLRSVSPSIKHHMNVDLAIRVELENRGQDVADAVAEALFKDGLGSQ